MAGIMGRAPQRAYDRQVTAILLAPLYERFEASRAEREGEKKSEAVRRLLQLGLDAEAKGLDE